MNTATVPHTTMKILLNPVYFKYEGEIIKIPAGYAFDGLSIPRMFQFLVDMNDSDNILNGLIHDYIYSKMSTLNITRQEADLYLYTHSPFPPSIFIYLGVRIGGFFAWKKDTNYVKYRKQIEYTRKTLNLPCLTT